MGSNVKQLIKYRQKLLDLQREAPKVTQKLLIQEGEHAARQAKVIASSGNPDAVDTGRYRNHFHTGNRTRAHANNKEYDGSKPRTTGMTYQIDVYNNVPYARVIEYGRRTKSGSFVKGRYILRRAMKQAEASRQSRLQRKFSSQLKQHFERG
ncbi:HK97 gp10 family phage protein [Paenibacillus arenosi]|uniref:HK97 gp10 family phage protein n=1 Tax=Paenibacillus arenosi TaxID=2774142 RepID=A0ABR9B1F4_9BACL|nr:HK97 gp10 family phage protein [Paenibacillus arenosi]MBD8499961.1 HK97 gp10 family phage protein [Paenibacillus arenosi]